MTVLVEGDSPNVFESLTLQRKGHGLSRGVAATKNNMPGPEHAERLEENILS
jgi:hypothetical protein